MILKGAIDSIHPQKIGGWIYSDVKSVRGTEVQAFVGDNCVGAGRVEFFRQDLSDAGLGDGYLGFSFPVSLKEAADCGRITVKISESDFLLLPAQAEVQTPNRFSAYGAQPYTDSSVEFMRKKGWLTSSELSFLKFSRDLGVFDISLVRPKSERGGGTGDFFQPIDLAMQYLSLVSLTEAYVQEIELRAPSAEDVIASVEGTVSRPSPFVGLLASNPCHLEVIEGSHKDEIKSSSLIGSVQHVLGPDRLVFINLLCSFATKFEEFETSLRVFVTNGSKSAF